MGQKVLTGDGVLVEVADVVNDNDGITSGDSSALYPVWDTRTGKYNPVTVEEFRETVGITTIADGTAVGDLVKWDGSAWTKASKSEVLGYKVYSALLTQDGTNAPVATVLENTIGDIVWSYESVGVYYGTLVGAFPYAKTFLIPEYIEVDFLGETDGVIVKLRWGSVDSVIISSTKIWGGEDSKLSSIIEIRVYN